MTELRDKILAASAARDQKGKVASPPPYNEKEVVALLEKLKSSLLAGQDFNFPARLVDSLSFDEEEALRRLFIELDLTGKPPVKWKVTEVPRWRSPDPTPLREFTPGVEYLTILALLKRAK